MAQDVVNENQNISYTNLDFSSIYTEVLDLVKRLTYRWDPSISDESDPGVILVKLSALIADKCNYNIDKNVLENFPLSVTQNGNARQLYDQLGYYMNWYESASVPVYMNWIGETEDSSAIYTIPKFTTITDSESSHIYALIGAEGVEDTVVSDIALPADGKIVTAIAMEGTPVQYQFENESVITSQMVDPISRRLYFPHSYVSQNGVFIKNTDQENFASWKRVNNLYENSYDELRYIFGYDSTTDSCFIEFPDNYAELFGNGIEITYLVVPQTTSDIPAQTLTQFLAPLSLGGEAQIVLDASNVKISNYVASSGHKDIEGIDEAYSNYKRTVGTFNTLITLRDYINYVRSNELDICSNAFVCDRTNDVQCSYKIMSNQHDLDTIIVKVEQVVDDSIKAESTFDYTFIKSSDTSVVPGKKYYEIIGREVKEIENPSPSENPKHNVWYELSSIDRKIKDALSPFSLKFYLLRKAIALNSKLAYNQTFSMMKPYPDFDTLFENTSHIEHVYEDILPLGENTYKKSEDTEWLSNKSYWVYNKQENSYTIVADTSQYEVPPAEIENIYEIDIEAMMPHVIMFKGVYPVVFNISTFDVLDAKTQTDITNNIITSLYNSVNSSQVEFGSAISLEYLSQIAKESDSRIKNISVDPVNYDLYATYYDKDADIYVEVRIDDDASIYDPESYRSLSSLTSAQIKKDIIAKSILSGTTQLLIPDSTFIYHLSQKYIDYISDISNITGEAIIDIQNDSITSYSLSDDESYIRKTYTLKDNEIIALYRPEFEQEKKFTNNVHFEYLIYRDLEENSSYKLQNNEYLIMYTPIADTDNASIIGYTAYACSAGAIIHTSFFIPAQESASALSSFARANIITYFAANPTQYYYEQSTYNENYKTEIRNSSSIINNVIRGTNEISIESASVITINREDKYKFFWILSEPTYSNDSNLKSYTLFDTYDSINENNYSEYINTYTLRNGETLLYTNEDGSNLAVLGAGTTLIRNCGVESADYTKIYNSLYYVSLDDINSIDDSSFSFATDNNSEIMPEENGLFIVDGTPSPVEVSINDNPFALGLYELVDGRYIATTNTEVALGATYYKPEFIRAKGNVRDPEQTYYILVMRKDSGWCIENTILDEDGNEINIYVADNLDTGCFKEVNLYTKSTANGSSVIKEELYNPYEMGLYEVVSHNNEKFIDTYALNSNTEATEHDRYSRVKDTETSIINRNILADSVYSSINIQDTSTYTSIDSTAPGVISPVNLNLLDPTYKKYFKAVNDDYEEVSVDYTTRPANEGLYEWDEDTSEYVLSQDAFAEVISISKATEVDLFKEVPNTFNKVSNSFNIDNYYYKISSINSVYFYRSSISTSYLDNKAILDASYNYNEYNGQYSGSPLTYLYIKFNSTEADDYLENRRTHLKNISNNWLDAIAYYKPYQSFVDYAEEVSYTYGTIVRYSDNETYKCKVSNSSTTWVEDEWERYDIFWAVKDFRKTDEKLVDMVDSTDKYMKVAGDSIIIKDIKVNNIYPALEGPDQAGVEAYFFIPASFYNPYYMDDTLLDEYCYTMLDVYKYIDDDLKLARLFPNSKNDVSNYGRVHVYILPRVYKFNDFVRYTYKSYYEPKEFFNRTCGEIKAWTCSALDYNDIIDKPYKSIGELWTSLQNNTSLTIIKNKIESFATGDTLIFETHEASEAYTIWPIFSNMETTLDLKMYDVAFQRVGKEIETLNSIDVDDYKWKGYSSLMLNTSSPSGQKLEYNHSLTLYDSEAQVEPIAVLNGSDYPNTTFQLKYPVDNKLGTFIDVSTTNMLRENVLNELYAFSPIPNGTYYGYSTDDYKTYLYFNLFSEGEEGSKVYDPQEIMLPIGLPKGNYLLGIGMKDDIELTIDYLLMIEGTNTERSSVSCNAIAQAVPAQTPYEKINYTFDTNYSNPLSSYVDDDIKIFKGDRYEYIRLGIDIDYRKIGIPSLISYLFNKSPQSMGWYELVDGEYVRSSKTGIGIELLDVVEDVEGKNPSEERWYEYDSVTSLYSLSTDTEADPEKIYFEEPELYIYSSDANSYLKFVIDYDEGPITYTILDVFKYENNPILGEGFEEVKAKIKQLDYDREYNYMFIPKDNDLIENPLNPKSFWNVNHIYNKFTIPQLNFDDITFRYVTTKADR